MKRASLHILFWMGYVLATAGIEFLWRKATLTQFSENQLIIATIEAALFYCVSKIIFAYYVSYYAINKIIRKNQWRAHNILEIGVMFLACIIIDRAIANWLILPYAYHNFVPPLPIFEPRSIILTILFIVFSSGLMMAIKSVKNQLKAKEREKNLVKDKLEAELKFLRNQTNPHFLLNTLYNIYALARKGSEDTAEVVMRLSELLRFMLYESGGNLISLKDEIKVLEDYLELERIRYNNRLSVSFTKEVDSDSYQITPLLLLPFLENAFKHGVSETRFETFINIEIKIKQGKLNFEIENSYDKSQNGGRENNIGLISARRQLELTYSQHKLEINDADNIFKVNLFINLDSYAEI
jgi:two-component system, LytTR family, sensor kinase